MPLTSIFCHIKLSNLFVFFTFYWLMFDWSQLKIHIIHTHMLLMVWNICLQIHFNNLRYIWASVTANGCLVITCDINPCSTWWILLIHCDSVGMNSCVMASAAVRTTFAKWKGNPLMLFDRFNWIHVIMANRTSEIDEQLQRNGGAINF